MLRLRPFVPDDAKTIVSWITDERMFYEWTADRYNRYPIGPEDVLAQYGPFLAAGAFFPMTAEDEDGPAGHLILRWLDEEKTDLRFGFIIVDPARRGRGYGREMLRLAQIFAFDVLQARRVSLGVFAQNLPAVHCYRAAGFRETGQEPEIFEVMGEQWKCVEMELPAPAGSPDR